MTDLTTDDNGAATWDGRLATRLALALLISMTVSIVLGGAIGSGVYYATYNPDDESFLSNIGQVVLGIAVGIVTASAINGLLFGTILRKLSIDVPRRVRIAAGVSPPAILIVLFQLPLHPATAFSLPFDGLVGDTAMSVIYVTASVIELFFFTILFTAWTARIVSNRQVLIAVGLSTALTACAGALLLTSIV